MKIRALTAMAIMTAAPVVHADERIGIRHALEDPALIKAMRTAWIGSESGTANVERGFRLDGSPADYEIVAGPRELRYRAQAMLIFPGKTFAVFHTHPNKLEAAPSANDRKIADTYGITVYTMHGSGLYEYDPLTGKTTRIREGLDWLKPVANRQGLYSSTVLHPRRERSQ